MASKIWFITGASRGFGRIWAEAALKRGDKVAATARDIASLKGLVEKYGANILPIALDVNDRTADFEAVNKAYKHFGRIDVLINNAGFGLFGAIEEVTEKQVRDQFETNVFGALWVTQAIIPIMRSQGGGHILQVSSIAGVTTFPIIGIYHASKWALEGFSEALSKEVEIFGIKVTMLEPGAFATDWAGSSGVRSEEMDVYAPIREIRAARVATTPMGDPHATAAVVLKVVDSENPPLRIFLGKIPFPVVKERYAERIKTWEDWQADSIAAQGD